MKDIHPNRRKREYHPRRRIPSVTGIYLGPCLQVKCAPQPKVNARRYKKQVPFLFLQRTQDRIDRHQNAATQISSGGGIGGSLIDMFIQKI